MAKPISSSPGYQRVLERRRADREYLAQHTREERRYWNRYDAEVRERLIERNLMAGLTRYVTREEFYA